MVKLIRLSKLKIFASSIALTSIYKLEFFTNIISIIS